MTRFNFPSCLFLLFSLTLAGAAAEPGTPLQLEVRGRKLPARVEALPFVPHRYHR